METAVIGAATSASSAFEAVLTAVAPLAILVAVGLMGARIVIKLFNRGVGK
jgi:hypothetical protein